MNALRKVGSASAFGLRLARLVHESAQSDPVERARHGRFIASRLTLGALALAGLAPYLLWRGAPSAAEAAGIVCLVMPLVAAAVLSWTGRLAPARAISAAAWAGLIVCIATASAGAALAALLLLTVILVAYVAAQPATPTRPERGLARTGTWDAQDRSLLHAIDDLVTWHDRNGRVLKANAAAVKLLGAPACSLQGQGLFARVHVSDRPAFLKAVSDAAGSAQPVAVEFRLRAGEEDGAGGRWGPGREARAPERVIWVEMRAHRIDAAGPDGADCAVVAVTRDISEHKRRAGELEEARAAAECADQSKGRFLATVSHELRTPLNAIIGFSEILATDNLVLVDGARRKEYAQIIHSSGQHLLGVVNTLLDMSKIESGKFEVAPEPFDFGELASASCELMQLKAAQAGLTLVRDIPSGLPEVVADRRACRQILINLLSNALKFTPRGGRVTVSVRRERGCLLLSVADTGVGIAEEDLPKIGDPFFQAGSHYNRSHEGTGLGLSVVRGLVGLHRGTLAVESALGEGTTVTATLPLDCRSGAAQAGGPIPIRALKRPTTGGLNQRMKHRA